MSKSISAIHHLTAAATEILNAFGRKDEETEKLIQNIEGDLNELLYNAPPEELSAITMYALMLLSKISDMPYEDKQTQQIKHAVLATHMIIKTIDEMCSTFGVNHFQYLLKIGLEPYVDGKKLQDATETKMLEQATCVGNA